MATKKRKVAKSAAKKQSGGKLVARKPAAKRKSAAKKVSAIPKGYHTATPYLIVRGAAKALGYRVSGGWTVCRVFDPGSAKTIEARFWIGADDPMSEAYTENLVWVSSSADGTEKTLSVRDVPPIAFSEGMRMASALYGKRKIEKKEDENA